MQGSWLPPVQVEKQWGNRDRGWGYFLLTYQIFNVMVQRLSKPQQFEGKNKFVWIDCLELKDNLSHNLRQLFSWRELHGDS